MWQAGVLFVRWTPLGVTRETFQLFYVSGFSLQQSKTTVALRALDGQSLCVCPSDKQFLFIYLFIYLFFNIFIGV